MKNSSISIFGARITWRRIVTFFSAFALIILTSQMTMLLQFKTNDIAYEVQIENYIKERAEAFMELADNMNKLIAEYNYTIYEYFAEYQGTGQLLELDWYENPISSFGLVDYLYGLNPVDDLRENWVQIGRFVSVNGELIFMEKNYAINGINVALVGKMRDGTRYIDKSQAMPIDQFIYSLYFNAHPRELTQEEIDALITDRDDFGARFKAALQGAIRTNKEGDWYHVAQLFNCFSIKNGLLPYFKAKITPSRDTYKLIIGRNEFVDRPLYGNSGKTTAKVQTFVQTIKVDEKRGLFEIMKMPSLNRGYFEKLNTRELFKFLTYIVNDKDSNYFAMVDDIITSYSSSLGEVYDDSYIPQDYHKNTNWNTIYTEDDWSEELVSVAVVALYDDVNPVVSSWNTDSYLPAMLDEAMKTSVYGFVDKFSFQTVNNENWQSVLLDTDNPGIMNYDILFVDDYDINPSLWDGSVYSELAENEQKVLAEWVYAGGSLFLSSAVDGSGVESVIKDKIFPSYWIEKMVTNIVLDGSFLMTSQSWYNNTDTPAACSQHQCGEYVAQTEEDGLIAPAAEIGISRVKDLDLLIGQFNEWVGGSEYSDWQIIMSQPVDVPSTFYDMSFYIDYKKLVGIDTSTLKVQLNDKHGNVVFEKMLSDRAESVHTQWQNYQCGLTQELRPYAGDRLYLHIIMTGTHYEYITQYLDDNFEPTTVPVEKEYKEYNHGRFLIDNVVISSTGGKNRLPVLIYHDQELMEDLDTIDFGDWVGPDANYHTYPYLSINEYRAKYISEALKERLMIDGYPYVEVVNSEEVKEFLEFGEQGVIIATHPFVESIFDGDSDNPLINWVKDTGGIFIDTMVEPLAYYIDESTSQLVRVHDADVAIIGADLFKSVLSYDGEYTFAIYSENFDDDQASYTDSTDSFIALETHFGGYLNIATPGTYYDEFLMTSEIIIRDGATVNYGYPDNNLFLHFDAYLTDKMTVNVHGTDQYGNDLILECVLGENTFWHPETSGVDHSFHMNIPFNAIETPSELDHGNWASVLIDLDILLDGIGSNYLFYEIDKLEFITTGENTLLDNVWIGYAGSVLEMPTGWAVQSLDPFISDYPASLNVLQTLRDEDPLFDFEAFARSEGIRELLIWDDFVSIPYPEDDAWCELPHDNWTFNGEEVGSNFEFFAAGESSLQWNSTGTAGTIQYDLTAPLDITNYCYFVFSISANTSLYDWVSSNPKITLIDGSANELEYDILTIGQQTLSTYRLELAEMIGAGTFDFTDLETIEVSIPAYTQPAPPFAIYLDNIHLETGLDDDLWYWEGLVDLIGDALYLGDDVTESTAYIQTWELFGLGSVEFEAILSPHTDSQMGIFGGDDGDAYFEYKGTNNKGWWNYNWRKRTEIVFEDYAIVSNLENFPAYIKINSLSGMQDDYDDIRFVVQSDNEMYDFDVLPYELTTPDSATPFVWVLVPSLIMDGDTKLYMYYDNPNAFFYEGQEEFMAGEMWEKSGYVAVYHMDEINCEYLDDSGELILNVVKDSTINNIDLDNYGNRAEGWSYPGLVDGGILFDNTELESPTLDDNPYWGEPGGSIPDSAEYLESFSGYVDPMINYGELDIQTGQVTMEANIWVDAVHFDEYDQGYFPIIWHHYVVPSEYPSLEKEVYGYSLYIDVYKPNSGDGTYRLFSWVRTEYQDGITDYQYVYTDTIQVSSNWWKEFHYVAMSYDGQKAYFYVDGELIDEMSPETPGALNTNRYTDPELPLYGGRLWIGTEPVGCHVPPVPYDGNDPYETYEDVYPPDRDPYNVYYEHFDGLIDEVRVSKYAKPTEYFAQMGEMYSYQMSGRCMGLPVSYTSGDSLDVGETEKIFYGFTFFDWEMLDFTSDHYDWDGGWIGVLEETVYPNDPVKFFDGVIVYEATANTEDEECYIYNQINLQTWDGVTDVPIHFSFRAQSDLTVAGGTQFNLKLASQQFFGHTTLIPHTNPSGGDYYYEDKDNKNDHTWYSEQDTGWQEVYYEIPASDLADYKGETILVMIGFDDEYTGNYQQKVFIRDFTVGEPIIGESGIGGGCGEASSKENKISLELVYEIQSVPADWWDEHWAYRREIRLTNGGSVLDDYQLKVTIPLSVRDATYNNGDDLRFASPDGTEEYSYWIEDWIIGTVWVKIPQIAYGTNMLDAYVYYGNPGARSKSDPWATFLAYDDFDTGYSTGNTPKAELGWSIVAGNPTIQNDPEESDQALYLETSGGSSTWDGVKMDWGTIHDDVIVEFNFRDDYSISISGYMFFYEDGLTRTYSRMYLVGVDRWQNYDGSYSDFNPDIYYTQDSWDTYQMLITGNDLKARKNGGSLCDGKLYTSYTNGVNQFQIRSSSASSTAKIYVDDFVVRKYAVAVPTAFLGTEEDLMLASADDWWNTDWDYRRLIEIGGTAIGYGIQHKLILDSSIRSSCQANAEDLRFVSRQYPGKILDYWIEDWSTGTVWVEQDYLPSSGDRDFFMYYGNDDVGSGVNTFNEGFESSTFFADGWENIEDDGGTTFTQSTNYVQSGSYSGMVSYDSGDYSYYRTDKWISGGLHGADGTTFSGWVRADKGTSTNAYFYPVFVDWNNYVALRFYTSTLYIELRIGGVKTESSTYLGSTWYNKEIQWSITIDGSSADAWAYHTDFNPDNVTVSHSWSGEPGEGYAALRTRSKFGPYYFDDLELTSNIVAQSMSCGDDTFPFFDDFSGTSLDTDKWNLIHEYTAHTHSYDVSNDELHIYAYSSADTSGYDFHHLDNYDLDGFELRIKSRWANLDYTRGAGYFGGGAIYDTDSQRTGISTMIYGDYRVALRRFLEGSASWVSTYNYLSSGTSDLSIKGYGTNIDMDMTGTLSHSWSGTLSGFSYPLERILIQAYLDYWTGAVSGDFYYDIVYLRSRAASTDPGVTIGGEELRVYPQPANLQASDIRMHHLTLSWDEVVGVGITYKVYKDYGSGWEFCSETSDTQIVLEDLLAGTEHDIGVSTCSAGSESAKTVITETTMAELSAPANVAVEALSPFDITISWDAVTGAIGYNVYEKIADEYFFVAYTTDLYFDHDVDPDSTYDFVVCAGTEIDDESPYSNPAQVTMDDLPVLEEYWYEPLDDYWQSVGTPFGFHFYFPVEMDYSWVKEFRVIIEGPGLDPNPYDAAGSSSVGWHEEGWHFECLFTGMDSVIQGQVYSFTLKIKYQHHGQTYWRTLDTRYHPAWSDTAGPTALSTTDITDSSMKLRWDNPLASSLRRTDIYLNGKFMGFTSDEELVIYGLDPDTEYTFDIYNLYDDKTISDVTRITASTLAYQEPIIEEEPATLQAVVSDGTDELVKEIVFEQGFDPTAPHVYKIVTETGGTYFYIDDHIVAEFTDAESEPVPAYSDATPAHKLKFLIDKGSMILDWMKMAITYQSIYDGPLPGATKTGEYQLVGDVFIDPLAITCGDGWLAFVKNAPVTPLTLDHRDESDLAIGWIAYMLNEFFANKVKTNFDFYWATPGEGATRAPTSATIMSPYNDFGRDMLTYPYEVNYLSYESAGAIPALTLPKYEGYFGFEPMLQYIDDVNYMTEITDGYIDHWYVNTFKDLGGAYRYPDDIETGGIKDGAMMVGSQLYRTTFDPVEWYLSNQVELYGYDIGIDDAYELYSGLQYDDVLNQYVLRLEEYNLLPDPEFRSLDSVGYVDSPHFHLSADAGLDMNPVAPFDNAEWGHTWLGNPAPGLWYYADLDDRWVIGTALNPQDILDNFDSTTDWYLSFDYWLSNTTETDVSADVEVRFFKPVGARVDAPVDANDLYDSNNFTEIEAPIQGIDPITYTLENTEENKYETFIKSNLITTWLNWYYNQAPTEELIFMTIEVRMNYHTGRMTGYLDNLYLTPETPRGSQGDGQGYGLELDNYLVDYCPDFDAIEDTKVCYYPIITLGNVTTRDNYYDTGRDYEFVVKVVDPTYNYDIYLHYCWSQDGDLIGGHENNEYVIDGNRIDFYVQQSETLSHVEQYITIDLLNTLASLVKESKIVLDREHIYHILDFELNLDGTAGQFQLGVLSVEGVAPWRFSEPINNEQVYTPMHLGSSAGHSEIMAIYDTYVWSEMEQYINIRVAGGEHTILVNVNNELVMSYNEDDYTTVWEWNPTGYVHLLPGVNKISVKVACGGNEGHWFKLRLVKISDSSEVPVNDVYLVLDKDTYKTYPVVHGSLGQGKIVFSGIDYESSNIAITRGTDDPIVETNPLFVEEILNGDLLIPYTDQPILKFIKNILFYDMESINPDLGALIAKFQSTFDASIDWKHQDVPYDSNNADDPYITTNGVQYNDANPTDYERYLVDRFLSSHERLIAEFVGRIMATARAYDSQELGDYETGLLNNLLSGLFFIMQQGGTNDYTSSTNYLPKNAWRDNPDIDLATNVAVGHNIALYAGSNELRIMMYGQTITSGTNNVLLYMEEWYENEYGNWYESGNSPYGTLTIYDAETVTYTIKDDSLNVYGSVEDDTLVEVLNLLLDSIQQTIYYDSKIMGELALERPEVIGEVTEGLSDQLEDIPMESLGDVPIDELIEFIPSELKPALAEYKAQAEGSNHPLPWLDELTDSILNGDGMWHTIQDTLLGGYLHSFIYQTKLEIWQMAWDEAYNYYYDRLLDDWANNTVENYAETTDGGPQLSSNAERDYTEPMQIQEGGPNRFQPLIDDLNDHYGGDYFGEPLPKAQYNEKRKYYETPFGALMNAYSNQVDDSSLYNPTMNMEMIAAACASWSTVDSMPSDMNEGGLYVLSKTSLLGVIVDTNQMELQWDGTSSESTRSEVQSPLNFGITSEMLMYRTFVQAAYEECADPMTSNFLQFAVRTIVDQMQFAVAMAKVRSMSNCPIILDEVSNDVSTTDSKRYVISEIIMYLRTGQPMRTGIFVEDVYSGDSSTLESTRCAAVITKGNTQIFVSTSGQLTMHNNIHHETLTSPQLVLDQVRGGNYQWDTDLESFVSDHMDGRSEDLGVVYFYHQGTGKYHMYFYDQKYTTVADVRAEMSQIFSNTDIGQIKTVGKELDDNSGELPERNMNHKEVDEKTVEVSADIATGVDENGERCQHGNDDAVITENMGFEALFYSQVIPLINQWIMIKDDEAKEVNEQQFKKDDWSKLEKRVTNIEYIGTLLALPLVIEGIHNGKSLETATRNAYRIINNEIVSITGINPSRGLNTRSITSGKETWKRILSDPQKIQNLFYITGWSEISITESTHPKALKYFEKVFNALPDMIRGQVKAELDRRTDSNVNKGKKLYTFGSLGSDLLTCNDIILELDGIGLIGYNWAFDPALFAKHYALLLCNIHGISTYDYVDGKYAPALMYIKFFTQPMQMLPDFKLISDALDGDFSDINNLKSKEFIYMPFKDTNGDLIKIPISSAQALALRYILSDLAYMASLLAGIDRDNELVDDVVELMELFNVAQWVSDAVDPNIGLEIPYEENPINKNQLASLDTSGDYKILFDTDDHYSYTTKGNMKREIDLLGKSINGLSLSYMWEGGNRGSRIGQNTLRFSSGMTNSILSSIVTDTTTDTVGRSLQRMIVWVVTDANKAQSFYFEHVCQVKNPETGEYEDVSFFKEVTAANALVVKKSEYSPGLPRYDTMAQAEADAKFILYELADGSISVPAQFVTTSDPITFKHGAKQNNEKPTSEMPRNLLLSDDDMSLLRERLDGATGSKTFNMDNSAHKVIGLQRTIEQFIDTISEQTTIELINFLNKNPDKVRNPDQRITNIICLRASILAKASVGTLPFTDAYVEDGVTLYKEMVTEIIRDRMTKAVKTLLLVEQFTAGNGVFESLGDIDEQLIDTIVAQEVAFFMNSKVFKKVNKVYTRMGTEHIESMFNSRKLSTRIKNTMYCLFMTKAGMTFLGKSAANSFAIPLGKNLGNQAWNYWMIQYFEHMGYVNTLNKNLESMHPGMDMEWDTDDDYYGCIMERYINDPIKKYSEGITMSFLVWFTDYVEGVPADAFEYVNGYLSGVQRGKAYFGMMAVEWTEPAQLAPAFYYYCYYKNNDDDPNNDIEEAEGMTIPDWIAKLDNWFFRYLWKAVCFIIGSFIATTSELLSKLAWVTPGAAAMGLLSTGISLIASTITSLIYSAVKKSIARGIARNGILSWSSRTAGDEYSNYMPGDNIADNPYAFHAENEDNSIINSVLMMSANPSILDFSSRYETTHTALSCYTINGHDLLTYSDWENFYDADISLYNSIWSMVAINTIMIPIYSSVIHTTRRKLESFSDRIGDTTGD